MALPWARSLPSLLALLLLLLPVASISAKAATPGTRQLAGPLRRLRQNHLSFREGDKVLRDGGDQSRPFYRQRVKTAATVFPWQNPTNNIKIQPAERKQLMPLSSNSVLDELSLLCTDAIFTPASRRLSNELQKYLYKKIIERYGPSNENENRLFLALDQGNAGSGKSVYGCVGLEVVPVTIEGKTKGEGLEPRPLLEFLAVDQTARGRGLGKALLKQCEAQVRKWGYDEIILQVAADNDIAINLYKKLGYTVVGEDNTILRPKDAGVFGGMSFEPALHLCMRKNLAQSFFSLPSLF